MSRAPLLTGLPAALIAVALAAPAVGQAPAARGGEVVDIMLPGGVRAAAETLQDPVAPDRAQFLVEFIRRTYAMPLRRPSIDPRAAALQTLLAHLDRAAAGQNSGAASDTIPLPLTTRFWSEVVFEGRVPPEQVLQAILKSRNAALFYSALLSLDDQTRAWLAGNPPLVAEIVSHHAAAFLVAAPGLRVMGGALQVPGGSPAIPAWEAVIGQSASDPVAFVRALLAGSGGRLAYFFRAVAELTPAQIQRALGLDLRRPQDRIAATRRLAAVFDNVTGHWDVEQQPYWRPNVDPGLLMSDLTPDTHGGPNLPGTAAFWRAAFGTSTPSDRRRMLDGDPVEFGWLCAQVFAAYGADQRSRYQAVLFASRILPPLTPENVGDAADAVRGAVAYPALSATLERAKLTDVPAYALAARAATRISGIGNPGREERALAQFQGAIALVSRAAHRGSIRPDALPALISSLSSVALSSQGEYEGRLTGWLDAHVRRTPETVSRPDNPTDGTEPDAIDENAPGPVERDLLHLLAGASSGDPQFVDWEGTRYRVDFVRAEAERLVSALGEAARPYVSSAVALARAADTLDRSHSSLDEVKHNADLLDKIWSASDSEGSDAPPDYRRLVDAMRRARSAQSARRLSRAARALADEHLARGLLELVYATALGHTERGSILAGEAASHHNFGLKAPVGHRGTTWRLGTPDSDPVRGWYVLGSVLGLDVALADLSLLRVSLKPRIVRPSLAAGDRRALIEAVVLTTPLSLRDSDRDAIVAAIDRGKKRLTALQTPADAAAIADELRLSAQRRTLLAWSVAHDPTRVGASLSRGELLRLGTTGSQPFQGWGAPAFARLGCLCLQIPGPGPWENVAGRWNTGMLVSQFPDLMLRLTELLAQLGMPAGLVGPVLASATLDFVDMAVSRDDDDRRGLVEFVNGLSPDKVEEYLALLTTGGPLVPTGDSRQPRPSE